MKKILSAALASVLAASAIIPAAQIPAHAQEEERMYKKGNYATTYTEVPASNPGRTWRDGMVSGNGLNGYVESGSPYTDTFIYQYMWFNYPSADPREIPEGLGGQLEDARQNVLALNDSWKVTDPDGSVRSRTFYYSYHPGHQLRMTAHNPSAVSDYERWTNYETAETGVKYTDEYGEWIRTSFTSRADNVSITKITSSSDGEKVNMTLSIDDISGMYKAYDQLSEVTALRYKKLVDDDASYIAQVAHYPSYEGSELADGGYAGVTRVIVEGGNKERVLLPDTNESMNVGTDQNPAIKITDADAVYLITESDRTFDMGRIGDFAGMTQYDLLDSLLSRTAAVQDKYTSDGSFDYDAALAPSAAKQAEEFNKVTFTLDGDDEYRGLDNNALINAQRNTDGRINHVFMQSIYEQGRYAQICCSGSSAPRLYGMWTGEWNPGWRAIYTLDANVNLQVSAMNTGNLNDMAMGYITFFLRNTPDFMANAEAAYNMHDAIQVSVNSDGDRAMHVEYDNAYPFQYWNAGASWCLLPIYEYWQCFGNTQIPINDDMRFDDLQRVLSVNDGGLTDEEFAALKERGYLDLEEDILLPLLTKQANFWEQICTPEYYISKDGTPSYKRGKTALEDGETYMIIPSYSPENHPIGYNSTITANSAMDISAARDGLSMVIAMENEVKRPGYEDAVAKWEQLLEKLPEYKIDEDGALCEWAMKDYTENNDHRHLSHLYCAWPAYETQNDEALAEAANIALDNRNKYNTSDATAGHGWMHKALVEARLKRGNGAIESMLPMTNGSAYYPSLMTDHDTNRRNDTYCTDTSFGTLGVVNEMLVFSNTGEIELVPALPTDWKSGSINGIVSRSRATVEELSWDMENGTVKAKIVSSEDGNNIALSCGLNWDKATVNGVEYTNNGSDIALSLGNGESAEIEFTLSEIQNGTYKISGADGVLSVEQSSDTENAAVAFTSDKGTYSLWNLELNDDMEYTIYNVGSGRQLTLGSNGTLSQTRSGSSFRIENGQMESGGQTVTSGGESTLTFERQEDMAVSESIDAVTIENEDSVSIARGESYSFTAKTVPAAADAKVRWSVTDADGGEPEGAQISSDGTLSVSADYSGGRLIVTAHTRENDVVSEPVTVSVSIDIAVQFEDIGYGYGNYHITDNDVTEVDATKNGDIIVYKDIDFDNLEYIDIYAGNPLGANMAVYIDMTEPSGSYSEAAYKKYAAVPEGGTLIAETAVTRTSAYADKALTRIDLTGKGISGVHDLAFRLSGSAAWLGNYDYFILRYMSPELSFTFDNETVHSVSGGELSVGYELKGMTDGKVNVYIARYGEDGTLKKLNMKSYDGIETSIDDTISIDAGDIGYDEYGRISDTVKLFCFEDENMRPANGMSGETVKLNQDSLFLPTVFGSNMVLQREQPINVWGRGRDGVEYVITLTSEIGSVTGTATAENGEWSVSLDALEGSLDAYVLTVEGGGEKVTVPEVYIGDVYVLAGQSNMEQAYDNFREQLSSAAVIDGHTYSAVTLADAPERPSDDRIKFFKVATATSETETFDAEKKYEELDYWNGLSEENNMHVSHIGMLFAERLLQDEPEVPVGLIDAAQGSTSIEQWVPSGDIYNNHIAPFTNFNISGILWYQGEDDHDSYLEYAETFPRMIDDWRAAFGNDSLPFMYVQLARYTGADHSGLREAQRLTLDNVSNPEGVGMIVSVDTDRNTACNIHPLGKDTLAERFYLMAQSLVYGNTDTGYSGPLFESAEFTGGTAVVSFKDGTADGLQIINPYEEFGITSDNIEGFEVAGADRRFYTADSVTIDGDKVIVASDMVEEPVYVRYAYSAVPENPNLYNSLGLPASPFTSMPLDEKPADEWIYTDAETGISGNVNILSGTADNMFDGDISNSTYFRVAPASSDYDETYIGVDLGELTEIRKLEIYAPDWYSGATLDGCVIEGRNAEGEWEEITFINNTIIDGAAQSAQELYLGGEYTDVYAETDTLEFYYYKTGGNTEPMKFLCRVKDGAEPLSYSAVRVRRVEANDYAAWIGGHVNGNTDSITISEIRASSEE